LNRRILVVDDDAAVREALQIHLGRAGHEVTAVSSAEHALRVLGELDPALLITDVRMPGMSGLQLLESLHESVPDLNVIVVTAFEDMTTAVGAIRAGAYDYLVKPLDLDQLELVLERALRDRALRQRVRQATEAETEAVALGTIVGRVPAMIEIYKRIGALAGNRAPVLVRGETGTGKEIIARAIHFNSAVAHEPFVAVNCTAVPEPLLESELFGHVRGAFTGAIGDRRGRFEQAGRGTIFLDEIGDVSPAFQAKLLRVLQEREFQPLGSERTRRTEARVIAATHADLETRVREGTFREDLYFRLRVVELRIPPLRERRDDIPLLVEHLTRRIARELHKTRVVVPAATMRLLQHAPWPGNVRELEHALVHAAVVSPSGVLTPEDLGLSVPVRAAGNGAEHGGDTLADAIRRHIRTILERTGGNKRAAARIPRISRQRLDRLLEREDREDAVASERDRDGTDA
jgi:two-component system, NtrC family, response regulator AtoC